MDGVGFRKWGNKSESIWGARSVGHTKEARERRWVGDVECDQAVERSAVERSELLTVPLADLAVYLTDDSVPKSSLNKSDTGLLKGGGRRREEEDPSVNV
jgi:hypothetical protein